VARTRIPEIVTLEDLLESCPRLRDAANGSACSEASAAGALVFDKSF
jgi:hypothetical protein